MSRAFASIERASSRARRIVERRAARDQRRRGAGHRGERRAQVVRDRSEQRVAQRLALGRDARAGRRLREPRALERQADLARERLEQVPLLGQQHAPRIARLHGQHTEAAAPIAERQIERRRGRQRIGAQARAAAVIGDPLRDGEIRAAIRAVHRRLLGITEPPRRVGQQHDALALKHLGDVLDGEPRHAVAVARRGELAAHRVEQRRAPLARAGDARLLAHARHQRRDDERNDQHDGERQQVLHVRDRERGSAAARRRNRSTARSRRPSAPTAAGRCASPRRRRRAGTP